jgi:hypothetical protein
MRSTIQYQAAVLERDLGLPASNDPVEGIVSWCENRVGRFMKLLPCSNLEELLGLVANKVGTRFRVVRTDAELQELVDEYAARREMGFATLSNDLAPDVFGETLRLIQRLPGELPYVSVIDARGAKAYREYFTKWHEIAHLLVLTDQARLTFFRSHAAIKNPEEQLMDVIAGRVGFYRPLLMPHLPEKLSFETIQEIQAQMCPSASRQSALIGVLSAWPKPALLLRAEVGVKKAEQSPPGQAFLWERPSRGQLRAVSVISNAEARNAGLNIYRNMRVPRSSVIAAATHTSACLSANEDLSWWESSSKGPLPSRSVWVQALRNGEAVDALVLDLSTNINDFAPKCDEKTSVPSIRPPAGSH